MKFNEINNNTREGRLLTFAIGKLMATQGRTNMLPEEVFAELEELRVQEQPEIMAGYPIELLTTFGSFPTVIPATTAENAAATAYIRSKTAGTFQLEDGSAILIAKPDELLAVKVYPATIQVDSDEEKYVLNPFETPVGKVCGWYAVVEFMGRKVEAEFLTLALNERVYILLYLVERCPALDTVSEKNHATIIRSWIKEQYPPFEPMIEVVVPHGAIAERDEAVDYLKDYAKEAAPQTKPKNQNAKAFQGWRETVKE